MPESKLEARIVLTTAANPDEAAQLARILVEERLTGHDQLAALKARIHELHSYEVPEFLVLDASSGSHPYLEWLHAGLRTP